MDSNRNRQDEDYKAKQRLASTLMDLNEQRRDEQWTQLIMVAQCLIVCGLPYNNTKERQVVRKARMGNGSYVSIAFTAALPGVDLPFGSDRTLLHWMVGRAIKAKSPLVTWKTAREFLHDAGMNEESGKNINDLRGRYRRLSGLAITVERVTADCESHLILPIIEESHLPSSLDVRKETQGERPLLDEPHGFKFNDRFFADVLAHHIPMPWDLIKRTRKQSQLQDLMMFLSWRVFSAKSSSLAPWDRLREQLWQEDSNPRRIRTRFKDAIEALKMVWPEFKAEARPEGLWIVPIKGDGLLPTSGDRKRLSLAAVPADPHFPVQTWE